MRDTFYKYRSLFFYAILVALPIICCLYFQENIRDVSNMILGGILGFALPCVAHQISEITNGNRNNLAPPDYDFEYCGKKSKELIDNIKNKMLDLFSRDVCQIIGDELDFFINKKENNQQFIYFLKGESGVGKSTLLALKAEEWQKSNHIVAYISGVSIKDKKITLDSTILDCFIEDGRQGNMENLLKKLDARFNKKKLEQKFILIIDGIDKHCDSNEIFAHFLMNHVPLFQKYPWCRVIISMNNEFIPTCENSVDEGDYSDLLNKAALYVYNQKNNDHSGELPALSFEECRDIYDQLKRQKGSDSVTNWDELPKDIQNLLNNYEFIYLFFSIPSEKTIHDAYSLMVLWKNRIYNDSKKLKKSVQFVVKQLIENTRNGCIHEINTRIPNIENAISCMQNASILKQVPANEGSHYVFSSEAIANIFFAEYIQNKITDEQNRQGKQGLILGAILGLESLIKQNTTDKLIGGIVYYLKESIFKLKHYKSSEDKITAIEVIFESLCRLDYQFPPHSSYLFTHGRAQSVYEIRTLFERELKDTNCPRKNEFIWFNSFQLSLALIRIGNPDEAIERLNSLSNQSLEDENKYENFKVAIKVYLALAHICKCEYNTAEQILKNISDRNSKVEPNRLGNLGAAILWQLKQDSPAPFPPQYIETHEDRLNEAETYFKSAIHLAQQNKDDRSFAFWSCYNGYYLYHIGKQDDAEEIVRKYAESCEKDRHTHYYFNCFLGEILSNSASLLQKQEGGILKAKSTSVEKEQRTGGNIKPNEAILKQLDN